MLIIFQSFEVFETGISMGCFKKKLIEQYSFIVDTYIHVLSLYMGICKNFLILRS